MRTVTMLFAFLIFASCGDNIAPTTTSDGGDISQAKRGCPTTEEIPECAPVYGAAAGSLYQCANSPGAWQVDETKNPAPGVACVIRNPDGSVWATLRADGCCPIEASNSDGLGLTHCVY